MIICFFGLAGSGKSTQAGLLAEKLDYAHISVGQLLRESHGEHLIEYMQKGRLINPMVVNEVLREALDKLIDKGVKGIILDGYPRQMEQATWLMDNRQKYDVKLAVVIDVPEAEVAKRLLARRRVDDNKEAIINRVKIFKSETEPVIQYMKQSGVYILRVSGQPPIEEVSQTIWNQVKNVASIA